VNLVQNGLEPTPAWWPMLYEVGLRSANGSSARREKRGKDACLGHGLGSPLAKVRLGPTPPAVPQPVMLECSTQLRLHAGACAGQRAEPEESNKEGTWHMDSIVNLVVLMAILSVSISLSLVFERTAIRGLFRLLTQRQHTQNEN
jgi:hypothetical protein